MDLLKTFLEVLSRLNLKLPAELDPSLHQAQPVVMVKLGASF
jgi:hypothetical protein